MSNNGHVSRARELSRFETGFRLYVPSTYYLFFFFLFFFFVIKRETMARSRDCEGTKEQFVLKTTYFNKKLQFSGHTDGKSVLSRGRGKIRGRYGI